MKKVGKSFQLQSTEKNSNRVRSKSRSLPVKFEVQQNYAAYNFPANISYATPGTDPILLNVLAASYL